MKIIEPSATLVDTINPEEILRKLEVCGRVSHKSNPTGRPLHTHGATADFVRKIIKRGHESVLEHVSLTFKIVCDRAIMAELTRHRLASFTVESTRYVKYDELPVIQPQFNDPDEDDEFSCRQAWLELVIQAEAYYEILLKRGATPELARSVLPQCTATTIYMTANLRELRHILKLRTAKAAHPQMRQIMKQILAVFKEKLPVIVEDIGNDD